jgi:hypothetical protein
MCVWEGVVMRRRSVEFYGEKDENCLREKEGDETET